MPQMEFCLSNGSMPHTVSHGMYTCLMKDLTLPTCNSLYFKYPHSVPANGQIHKPLILTERNYYKISIYFFLGPICTEGAFSIGKTTYLNTDHICWVPFCI